MPSDGFRTCPICHGKGTIVSGRLVIGGTRRDCPLCAGDGEIADPKALARRMAKEAQRETKTPNLQGIGVQYSREGY